MSDGSGDDRPDGEKRGESERSSAPESRGDSGADDRQRDREDRREPLGDVAEKVRERTGKTRERTGKTRERSGESRDRTGKTRDGTNSDAAARDGPMADVATKVDERRKRGRDRESETTDPFESVDVGELDGEKLWERLSDEEGEDPSVTVPPGESVAVEEDEEEWADRDVRTIPKETCHGCPHFGDPPELACTHEGTAILAMTDSEHFRVVDCPMVGEEEEIGSIAVDGDGASDDVGGLDGEHDGEPDDVVDPVDVTGTE